MKGASNLNYFPNNNNFNWNNDHLGPIYIPKKGDRIELDINNIPIYIFLIRLDTLTMYSYGRIR